MHASLLIKKGQILDPSSRREHTADIRLKDGDVVEVAQDLEPHAGEPVLDAAGLWIAPGFIDLHAHLREIGQSDREDIGSGTMAAAAGGFTCVLTMANTDPPIDDAAILTLLLEKIDEKARVDVLPVACVTRGMAGVELVNMVELAELGVAAFSDDGLPVSNLAVLRRALQYARIAGRPVISHAEDRDLSAGGAIHTGTVSTCLGLPGIPGAAEAAAVAREIEVVRDVGGRLHFAHISCAASVDLIRAARASGLTVTADATPHHLCLTVDDITSYDTSYKMNPPLRTLADQAALIEGLKDGTIDAVATDHAPHTQLDKTLPFDRAPSGVIGLETTFSLAFKRLVREKQMDKLEFIALLTTKPASVLGLPVPSIQPGQAANLVVLDPEHQWIYDATKGFSRSHNSPFHGQRLTGKSLITFCGGSAVYKDEALVTPRLASGDLTTLRG